VLGLELVLVLIKCRWVPRDFLGIAVPGNTVPDLWGNNISPLLYNGNILLHYALLLATMWSDAQKERIL